MMRTNVLKTLSLVVVLLGLVAFSIRFSLAGPTEPIGPNNITLINSSRISNYSYNPKIMYAEAGNISEINMNATSATKSWQGYFGEISGQIVLQDADNNTMYDWSVAEPEGHIYASTNSSVNWAYIRCFNHTSDAGYTFNGTTYIPQNEINSSIINARYQMVSTDYDTINATFDNQSHPPFSVGSQIIPANTCYNTWTYVNNATQELNFNELLLTDGDAASGGGNSLVFMTFIENKNPFNNTDPVGFDGSTHDFQMLVLEDGHPGASEDQVTAYYFWVEIQ